MICEISTAIYSILTISIIAGVVGITGLLVYLSRRNSIKVDKAFAAEYDMSKPSGITPKFNMKVLFPKWLDTVDRPAVLDVVDSYVEGMIKAYPVVSRFKFNQIIVYLHEAVSQKIVCSAPIMWCWGWRLGMVVYTPWRPLMGGDKTIGIASSDIFQVLPHELTHILAEYEIGAADPEHKTYFARPEIINMINAGKTNSKSINLSIKSSLAAMDYAYMPWATPKA